MISEEKLNRKYDAQFNGMQDLVWMPWVGQNYQNTRIAVIGESHYEDGGDWQEGNPDTTRLVMSKAFTGEPLKLCANTEKVLLDKDNVSQEERNTIWSSVVFVNLVQRLLETRTGDLKHKDMLLGWKVFFQLIDILKPDYCLVLAKGMAGALGEFLHTNDTGWERNIPEFYEKEKTVINLKRGGESLRLVFINHPTGSYGFDYGRWSDLLSKEAPEIKNRLTGEL